MSRRIVLPFILLCSVLLIGGCSKFTPDEAGGTGAPSMGGGADFGEGGEPSALPLPDDASDGGAGDYSDVEGEPDEGEESSEGEGEGGGGDEEDDVSDVDSDGVADTSDNCPLVANADQADMDDDGYGDLCDEDRDGDGIWNVIDNCPDVANANQANADGDHMGDVCDTIDVVQHGPNDQEREEAELVGDFRYQNIGDRLATEPGMAGSPSDVRGVNIDPETLEVDRKDKLIRDCELLRMQIRNVIDSTKDRMDFWSSEEGFITRIRTEWERLRGYPRMLAFNRYLRAQEGASELMEERDRCISGMVQMPQVLNGSDCICNQYAAMRPQMMMIYFERDRLQDETLPVPSKSMDERTLALLKLKLIKKLRNYLCHRHYWGYAEELCLDACRLGMRVYESETDCVFFCKQYRREPTSFAELRSACFMMNTELDRFEEELPIVRLTKRERSDAEWLLKCPHCLETPVERRECPQGTLLIGFKLFYKDGHGGDINGAAPICRKWEFSKDPREGGLVGPRRYPGEYVGTNRRHADYIRHTKLLCPAGHAVKTIYGTKGFAMREQGRVDRRVRTVGSLALECIPISGTGVGVGARVYTPAVAGIDGATSRGLPNDQLPGNIDRSSDLGLHKPRVRRANCHGDFCNYWKDARYVDFCGKGDDGYGVATGFRGVPEGTKRLGNMGLLCGAFQRPDAYSAEGRAEFVKDSRIEKKYIFENPLDTGDGFAGRWNRWNAEPGYVVGLRLRGSNKRVRRIDSLFQPIEWVFRYPNSSGMQPNYYTITGFSGDTGVQAPTIISRCPPGYVPTAISGNHKMSAGRKLRGVVLHCSPLMYDKENFRMRIESDNGYDVSTSMQGTMKEDDWTLRCGDQEAIVGIMGDFSDDHRVISNIGIGCKKVKYNVQF